MRVIRLLIIVSISFDTSHTLSLLYFKNPYVFTCVIIDLVYLYLTITIGVLYPVLVPVIVDKCPVLKL